MKLGSAWLDRYEAMRDAEKKWQQSVAEFRVTVPTHLVALVNEILSGSHSWKPVMEESGESDLDEEIFEILTDTENSNSIPELLASLEELKEIWKYEKELSFESYETYITVTVKTIFPPMRYLKMKLEQDHPNAMCEWNIIPADYDEMWSIRFTLNKRELVITYDTYQTPEKKFCVVDAVGGKTYFATPADVRKNVKVFITPDIDQE